MNATLSPKPSVFVRLKWSVKRRGMIGTVRLALLKAPRRLYGWLWDLVHGVETRKCTELDALDVSSENIAHGIPYKPTSPRVFRKMIRGLGIRYEDYNFVDFGSGKGRTLLLASEFPFRNIAGVEFSRQLHEIAERNIASFRGAPRKCGRIQSICIDAALYRMPPGNAVAYFNFPFHEPVMRTVMAAIDAFVRESQHHVVIVNYEPSPPITKLILNDPQFEFKESGRDYAIYQSR